MTIRDYNHPAFKSWHFGTSGIGKNTDFLPRLVREAKKAKWVCVFDHKREFASKLNLPVCETDAQLAAAMQKGGWVLFDPGFKYPGDRTAGFNFFASVVYGVSANGSCRGRKIFVADELQEVAGPNDQPFDLITLLDDGRSLRIDAMLIAQSPNGVHTKVRNQATEMFCFRQADDNALNFLTSNGFDETSIRNLQPGQWLWRNLNSGKAAKGGKAFQPDSKGIPSGGTAL